MALCRRYAKLLQEELTEESAGMGRHNISPRSCISDNFNWRLECGQSFSTPVLGWKKFTPSYIDPYRQETEVCVEEVI